MTFPFNTTRGSVLQLALRGLLNQSNILPAIYSLLSSWCLSVVIYPCLAHQQNWLLLSFMLLNWMDRPLLELWGYRSLLAKHQRVMNTFNYPISLKSLRSTRGIVFDCTLTLHPSVTVFTKLYYQEYISYTNRRCWDTKWGFMRGTLMLFCYHTTESVLFYLLLFVPFLV